MRGILKRKFAEVDDDEERSCDSSPASSLPSPASTEWDTDGESSSSSSSTENQDLTANCPAAAAAATRPIRSILKRPRLDDGGRQSSGVRFDAVTVFYFPRCQGFTSVPSRGGASLGMLHRHSTLRSYTLAQHGQEQQRWRRERLRERRRAEKLEALRQQLVASGAVGQSEAERLTADQLPDGDADADADISDAELEKWSFLQPYSYKQRQALLRTAGVKHIDKEEKRELHALRVFREDCGCNCQGFCEPETCECSLAGIKCQMDNSNFPCGCTKDGCGNVQGRVEFNTRRVQTHYIHTIMRLEIERQLQDDDNAPDPEPDHHQIAAAAAAPEDLQLLDDVVDDSPEKQQGCPFGFSAEDEGLPLAMPPTAPSYRFGPERSVVEENSCSSDMTDSSSCCSSSSGQSEDSDDSAAGSPGSVDTDYGGLADALSLCDCENHDDDNRQPRRVCCRQPPNSDATSTSGVAPTDKSSGTFLDNRASRLSDCLDENANQAADFLDDFPNTPSPSVDYYSAGSYIMDLSLSSDSDLEFFNADFYTPSGPLHNSFKGHHIRHIPDNLGHVRLLSPSSPPRYDDDASSTCLLESLIGLSEPSPEPNQASSPFRDDRQFLEEVIL